MTLLRWFMGWYKNLKLRRIYRSMVELYPDRESRAYAYLSFGVEILDIMMVGAGESLGGVQVKPNIDDSDGGYIIDVFDENDIIEAEQ